MKEALQIAAESIAKEKVRHTVNAVATGTAATTATATSFYGDALGYLPTVAVAAGLLVSCALFYKTYLEIKLTKVLLAKEGRRDEDQ